MKRYFIAAATDVQGAPISGEYHYIDLDNGYCAVVLIADHVDVPPGWQEMPYLLDATTQIGQMQPLQPISTQTAAPALAGRQAAVLTPDPTTMVMALEGVGVTATSTMLNAALRLAAIHPKFRP
jgi:hypothetical protein